MTTECNTPLPAFEIERRLRAELPCWHLEDGCLRRTYRTGDWNATLMVVNAIGHLAEAAWHHPELSVSYGRVGVRLRTIDAGGITAQDFLLARKIDDVVLWRPSGTGEAPVPGLAMDQSRIVHAIHG
ncbi:4a-hydroxytetrahydrobiopterin dehydratase [Xanthobacter sp. TB0136]|uniref:4a-hydroxytetrahydrobiopterin dehydratase n=1 Tax=Xanthobacter sp. TB0136 TaxID=3459177 RepID=UPI00403923F2